MKYFPERYDEIKSLNSVEKILSNINSNSEKSYSLTMKRSNKFLRGYTEKKFFKVISAEVPLGVLCVFEGQLFQKEHETIIKLNSKFHRTFRILLYVWGILPVFAIIINCFQIGAIALALLLPIAMFYTIIYFIIKFYFKKSYKNGIKDLKMVINE
ncbi:hypothetical protein FW781_21215 [Chryseobacterium panacisoli]|uniref:Uncharacterized protein n=1 Tax=Chryseobacterium panacisoli TaxID=1807141 RepID=A0A5D8ZCF6_9FLAO|nr:hypothetical protein [Chryseobacterium panacisoli]TZF92558.1 hypothetical protein FW781_21215 [Chryseobacterium panacisoli]